MIIDAHNHLGGPDRGDGASQTAVEIIRNMDRVGIDMAVVFPFNEVKPGISFSLANNYIAKATEQYPERLIGFARLDPNYGKKALTELDRAVVRLGLRGVKLHPSSQKFTLDNPIVTRIIEKAAELRVPVVFDSGKPVSSPEGIGTLAAKVPKAPIIMAHMQGSRYLEVSERFENVYLGTTGMFDPPKLQEALERLGAEKLVAGSDSPYIAQEREVSKFDTIPGIREKEKNLILGGNIRKILGL